MTFKYIAKLICDLEGKKKQTDIAQVSEILKILKKIFASDPVGVMKFLIGEGK